MKRAVRGKVVHVRLSEDEFLALQAFSAKAGCSVSAMLRSLSQQAVGLGESRGRNSEIAVKSYIGELTAIRLLLEAIACDLQGREEPRFDVLIDSMSRLALLLSDHASDVEAMCDASRHRNREGVAGDV